MAVSLEERVAAIEVELEQMKRQLVAVEIPPEIPWWQKIRGAFKDDPVYEEITRLGVEWRRTQPIAGDEPESGDANSLYP